MSVLEEDAYCWVLGPDFDASSGLVQMHPPCAPLPTLHTWMQTGRPSAPSGLQPAGYRSWDFSGEPIPGDIVSLYTSPIGLVSLKSLTITAFVFQTPSSRLSPELYLSEAASTALHWSPPQSEHLSPPWPLWEQVFGTVEMPVPTQTPLSSGYSLSSVHGVLLSPQPPVYDYFMSLGF